MIAPQSDTTDAAAAVQNCFEQKRIPVFEASGIDVTHNNQVKVIAYCDKFKLVEKEYVFSNVLNDTENSIETILQQNNVCIVMLEHMDMIFATTDLL